MTTPALPRSLPRQLRAIRANRYHQYADIAATSARFLEMLASYGASEPTVTTMRYAIAEVLGDTPDTTPPPAQPPNTQGIPAEIRRLSIDVKRTCHQPNANLDSMIDARLDQIVKSICRND